MKIAKKVLSVILAVMLVVGTVVIAVSAAGGRMATWSLTASVMESSGAAQEAADLGAEATAGLTPTSQQVRLQRGNKTAYTAAAGTLPVYDSDDTIKVKAGDVVWVNVALKTENILNPGEFQYQVFYDNNIFLSTTGTFTQMAIWNPDGEFAGYGDIKDGSSWARMAGPNRISLAPRTWTEEQLAASYFYNVISTTNPDLPYDIYGDDIFPDLDEVFVTIPVYVRPDATIGDTGRIFMPYESHKLIVGEFDDIYGIATYRVTMAETNLERATLNFVVVGDEPEVDYTALEAAITSFEALTASDYTADSWATANTAYNAAVAARTSESQDEVDAAAAALVAAIAALEEAGPVLDYTRINAALASVPADLSDYTTSTAAAVTAAKTAAESAKATATTQAALDTAAATLEAAVAALELKADFTDLIAALASAALKIQGDYTPASWADLAAAVSAGEALLANAADVSNQNSVSDAAADIISAIDALVPVYANYSAVDAALARVPADLTKYTTASVAVLNAAIAAVVRDLPPSQQATVNGFATDINNAIDALVPNAANFVDLQAAYDLAASKVEAHYTPDSWAGLATAMAAAKNILDNKANYTALNQDEIDTATANLTAAIGALIEADADYSAVASAIASAPADLSVYTDESVAAFEAAKDAVVYGLKAKDQGTVNEYAQAILDAIGALELKAIDLTRLNAAMARVDALNTALYTPSSLEAVTDADAAAEALLNAGGYTQAEVDAAAIAIENALAALVYVGADFTNLKAAIDDAATLNSSWYTSASWATFAAAVAAGEAAYDNAEDYTVEDQGYIDQLTANIVAAKAALVEADADYTAVTNAKAAANALTQSDYTTASWTALQAAMSDVIYDLKVKDQALVDDMAKAITDAIGALVYADADYGFLETQIGLAEKLTETDYTVASWAALQAKIDAVVYGLKIDEQTRVDQMADDIYRARRALVLAPAADYSEVNDTIDAFEALDLSLYTDASVAAVDAEIDKVDWTLNENFQTTVDAFAAAIKAAVEALELKPVVDPIDYSDLEAAIAEAKALTQADYTASSWAPLATALVAGESIVNLKNPEDTQEEVDAAAKAIRDAIAGLELIPIVTEGKVVSATVTEGPTRLKTYTFKVTGRANALRLFEYDNPASTVSIYRSSSNVSVATYNSKDEEVSDLSRDIAYEIWTVELSINPNTYVAIAKDNSGWEAGDLGKVFTVSLSAGDKEVHTLEASVEEVARSTAFDVTVTTGADVVKVRTLVNGVVLTTFNAAQHATANEDGTLTYNIFCKVYAEGENTVSVEIKTANGWEAINKTLTIVGK